MQESMLLQPHKQQLNHLEQLKQQLKQQRKQQFKQERMDTHKQGQQGS